MAAMRLLSILMLVMAVSSVPASAECDSIMEVRPVNASYSVGMGAGALTDTYLSPLRYEGLSFSLDYARRQAMRFDPQRWTMRLAGRLEAMYTQNASRNTTLWDAGLLLQWGMTRRFQLPHNITLAAGGSTSLYAGCLYNSRNGNNPASAKASWTVDVTGYCVWRARIGSLPVTLTYQPTLPVAGIFFSPDYGELYYEIYMGNHSGLLHPAWWGNYFSMENLVTADFHFGATALRVGFRSNVLSTRIENINTRIISNSFVVGVSGDWMSLDPRRNYTSALRIISAL